MKRIILTAWILCALLVSAGCGSDERSSVSKNNFDRLKMGMSYVE